MGNYIGVGERLKELRERLGLSQTDLANKLGKARQTIQNYESGNTDVPSSFANTVCEEYKVSVVWLLTGDGNMLRSDANYVETEHDSKSGTKSSPAGKEAEIVAGKNHVPLSKNNGSATTMIDILKLKASCGPGEFVPDDIEIVDNFPSLIKIWFPHENRIVGCIASGDSMTPLIYHRDYIFFVPGDVSGDGIYILKRGCDLICKRVFFRMNGSIMIKSENDRYPAEEFPVGWEEFFSIVGKVHGWMHRHQY